jgi:hypothetical protein
VTLKFKIDATRLHSNDMHAPGDGYMFWWVLGRGLKPPKWTTIIYSLRSTQVI